MQMQSNGAPVRFLLAATLSAGAMFAQMTVTGNVNGTILDQSGKAVPAVKVSLISQRTKDSREVTSNESGVFNFAAVTPDQYSLKVSHPGFRTFERTGIVVTVNERIEVPVSLQVGAVNETITVAGRARTWKPTPRKNRRRSRRTRW